MLVLTRKSHDSIRIGDNIKVTILRIKGNTVRIGVEAPDDVRIVRGELPHFGEFTEGGRPTEESTVADEEPINKSADSQEKKRKMPTPSRLKTYMPPCGEAPSREHPIAGNRLTVSDNLTARDSGLPLPPR